MRKNKSIKIAVILISIYFVLILGLNYAKDTTTIKEISYKEFMELVDSKQVSQVVITDKEITITPKDNSKYKGKILQTSNMNDKNLIPKLQELAINYDSVATKYNPIPIIIVVFIVILVIWSIWRNRYLKKENKKLLIKITELENKNRTNL